MPNPIKAFFEKKKTEAKFKLAGPGQKLGDAASAAEQRQRQQAAAAAASQRLGGGGAGSSRQHQPMGAAGVLVEVGSGEVLAMSSRPTYDPNHFNRYSPES